MSAIYDAYLRDRCEAWRTKYPARAEAFRRVVVAKFGMRGHERGAFARGIWEPFETDLIRAFNGWPEEREWMLQQEREASA